MALFSGRTTREIAIQAEDHSRSHDRCFERLERGLNDLRSDHNRMHTDNITAREQFRHEMSGEISKVSDRVEKLNGRFDGLILKIVTWQGALLIGACTIMGYLFTHGGLMGLVKEL